MGTTQMGNRLQYRHQPGKNQLLSAAIISVPVGSHTMYSIPFFTVLAFNSPL
jgi:hypothetical protein